jgi:hypothetical protein
MGRRSQSGWAAARGVGAVAAVVVCEGLAGPLPCALWLLLAGVLVVVSLVLWLVVWELWLVAMVGASCRRVGGGWGATWRKALIGKRWPPRGRPPLRRMR